ncbi:bifunctional [glutamine synthetase] adenylyltransferase/[glutamine synthetase]-adenylyl-L-tyrosine phosphorylase [Kitasatospora sp. NA04385]|uniref:bifunctional [glutamine synthetase] adenylyltransferase/[glutamine synthetase]-adenylyl-L-tyrosine phosphorylase n=1 Tax=Kitasatospora sp. NA04385 TaxID=2742135 RepID=UPI0015921960|nr:bifunctional [glutamine synthetase] adenylyltransferase/[glutamine synthetase]-adenylyl-L-tyrosine phosphorylase [Kitasatospora sp. NA04385]QKW19343.1 bifunctional [glutamine synthetase] adenylyltransferase/[glutamine synthetase]-adenylyl-L-tyrosine phosphorylase [Kitasatospora sp. NA04385]
MEERAGSRISRLETRLVRRGFSDPDQAVRLLGEPALQGLAADPVLLDALGAAADPDQALFGLARLLEALDPHERHTLRDTLTTSKPLRDRLLGVLGASTALCDHLARHPRDWHALVSFELRDIHPGRSDFLGELTRRVWSPDGGDRADALRAAYRRCLLAIAARDLSGTTDLPQAAAELADLAGATLQTALDIAAEQDPEAAAACRLAVIGMGKCGGRELNYVSDVDVIFVAEAREGVEEQRAVQAATRLAAHAMRLCSDTTGEGTIWPVDANLRPEGRNGPLVRTLASHLAYYQRWAKTWEFQALLKARPIAGDAELGRAYAEAIAPLVWQAAARENFVTDVQQMRRRVVDAIPAGEVDRQLKLGPGGLRDVEFAVQLLQLVHGRTDETLRSGNTLEALAALSAGGYVGRADAASLDTAYRFLRTLEHRIQLQRLRRTHLMPTDPADLRRLARTMAPLIRGESRDDPVAALQREWRRHAVEVRRLHERLFYRPLLDAVAELPVAELRVTGSGTAGLSTEAAKQRLAALGYADPAAALRHISALASGVSRKAAIQRTLLPVLLGWFADSADPDAGLLNFRQVSDALGRTPWYLRLLRDEGAAAEQLARVLSAGRLAPDLLLRAPEAVAMLGDAGGLVPRGRAALESEVLAAVGRAGDPAAAVAAVRAVRRRELFRTAAADVLGRLDEDPARALDLAGEALTSITAATLQGALRAAANGWEARNGELPTRIAIIAMGRFGGHELGYGSDADVLFVHEPRLGALDEDAARAAREVVGELRTLLAAPSVEPPLLVDADLRPEGRNGPLVRTLSSYAAYYARWSHAWESQALLRAEPMAGDEELGARFRGLIDPLRYPGAGVPDRDLVEIRRIKARIESERLPRGADPTTHTKIGRGGLADVEWTVQLLQLQHGHELPELRTTRTRAALAAATAAGLVEREDAEVLDAAWVLASRVRAAVMLVRGRAGDSFPGDARELAGVARYLGYGVGHSGELVDEYRRTTRRARRVVERLFYGSE